MEVGDADPGDGGARNTGQQHLSLGAFAGVEQQALVVPTEEVAVVVAKPGGRLARRPQHHQFPSCHVCLLRYGRYARYRRNPCATGSNPTAR